MTMATAPAMGQNTAPAMGPMVPQYLGPNSVPAMGPMVQGMGHNSTHVMGPSMSQHMGPNTIPGMGPKGQGPWEPGTLPPRAPQKTVASNLSEVDRGRIVGMWEAGRKPSAIATLIPCSKRTACKWINAYRNCGKDGLIDLRRSGLAGRPRKTTADENLAIIKAMDENHSRAATSSALAALKLRVSDRTIRRRIQEARAERRKRAAQSSRSSKVNSKRATQSSCSSKVNSVKTQSQTQKAKEEVFNPPPPPLPPVVNPLKDPMRVEIEPSTMVEVQMDAEPLPDSGPCCYVNL